MATGKSVNLRVRPAKSADLSYPVDGVILSQVARLGEQVEEFNVGRFYTMLGETFPGDANTPPDDSRLIWDSGRIDNHVAGVDLTVPHDRMLLSNLRNAPEGADLDRALMMRQNAYLTSYSPEVLGHVYRTYYEDQGDPAGVRHWLLRLAEDDAVKIHKGLTDAYKKRKWWGKVIEYARSHSSNDARQDNPDSTIGFQGATNTESWGYEFRYPSAENDLRFHQIRAGIRQEFLTAWRMSEMCRNGQTTFPNEIGAIDLSIKKLQSAYIDTLLFAPFSGIVTGVFHVEGDYVRAGEPVLRVENDESVYLVGTVKYRGMLRIGSKVDVSTRLFEAAGAAVTTVSGEVVAVRGHDSVSEQWDLLILCDNRTPANDPVLPVNYNFDFESTAVRVTP